jgi:hypothetical protein
LCYTLNMSENRPIWINWARTLQNWGINKGVASLLESAGSFGVLVAQLLYIGQPLLSGALPPRSLTIFASVLENPADRQEFVMLLREGVAHEPGT